MNPIQNYKKLKIKLQIYHLYILLAWFYWRPLLEGDFEICLGGPKFRQNCDVTKIVTSQI